MRRHSVEMMRHSKGIVSMDGPENQAVRSASDAAGRLFRVYERHCLEPTSDTLFDLLTAMHSLNDRLQKAVKRDFHHVLEFVALKAIRNLAHHQEELRSKVSVISVRAYSELPIMCIVRRDQVERAIESTLVRWREETQAACDAVFQWYGPAVNINPCVFNFMVRAYELLAEVGVRPPEEDVAEFEASYLFEEEYGCPHYIEGGFKTTAGEITALFESVIAEMPPP